MSVTAPELCSIDVCLPVLIQTLGISDPNTGDGSAVVLGAPYTQDELNERLFQADYELAELIAESLDNPYRAQFVTEETAFLADGALITAHLGKHGKVTLKAGVTEFLGQERDFHRIKYIRRSPAVYGSPKNLYAIHAGRIYFSDTSITGKLDITAVIKDIDRNNLLCPAVYQWGVIAKAVMMSANVGMPAEHRSYWANFAIKAENEIKAGTLSIPAPEQLERIGA